MKSYNNYFKTDHPVITIHHSTTMPTYVACPKCHKCIPRHAMKRHCEQKRDHQDIDPYTLTSILKKKAANDVNGVSGHKKDDDEIVDMDITGKLDYDEGFSHSNDWGIEAMEDIEEPSLQELLTLERFAGAGAAVEFLVHSNCQDFLWVSHSLAQTKYATHSGLSTIKSNGISCMPSHFPSLREFNKLNALLSRGTHLGLNLGVDFKVLKTTKIE